MLRHFLLVGFLVALEAVPLMAQPAAGKKFALLIGVKRYDNANFGNLAYTENDVTALAEILRPKGFEVTLLSDSQEANLQPTRANILSHIEKVLRKRNREDIVVFGFAGHGLQFEQDKASYFLPRDAEPNSADTMVSLKVVYDNMEECGAGVKLMFVDACRNQVKKERFRTGFDGDTTPAPPKGVCALFSCSVGQSALELNDIRHGLFFFHVLDGLRGKAKDEDGDVTVLGLAQYAMRQVKKAGYNQTPVLKGEVSDGTLLRVNVAVNAPEIKPAPSVKAKIYSTDRVSSTDKSKTVVAAEGELSLEGDAKKVWSVQGAFPNAVVGILKGDEAAFARNVFVATSNDSLKCYRLQTGQMIWSSTFKAANARPSLQFADDGRSLQVHVGSSVFRFDTATGQPLPD